MAPRRLEIGATKDTEARMTRKFTQFIAVASLFGGLTSTGVFAGQTASSSPVPHCEKMTINCWQKATIE
jgi:hypothetical protein